jgi:hypothetical protein
LRRRKPRGAGHGGLFSRRRSLWSPPLRVAETGTARPDVVGCGRAVTRAWQIHMTESGTSEVPDPPTSIDVSGITDRLETVSRETGLPRHRVFDQYLDLVISTFARDDDLHADIRETVVEYTDNPRELFQTYAEALGELVLLTENHLHDVIGEVYESYGMSSDHFGQYFTPHPTADLVAALSGAPGSNERLTDNACGSGRLLIAAHRRTLDEPGHPQYLAKDKDAMCAKMTVINFALFGIDGYVEQGDSITMTTQRAWRTGFSMDGTVIREVDLSDDTEQPADQPDAEAFQQANIGSFT